MIEAGYARVRWAATAILIACLAFFAVTTLHWPLVGDSSLMHYVAFLMHHGMRPYHDIAEINFPGAFLVDDAVIHMLGGGSVAWRIFDWMLMGAGLGAMSAIALPEDWFAGVFAGALLALIHGRDGVFDAGQRDLVIAVLLLIGYAALLRATRKASPPWLLLFGLCAGAAGTIKPTYVIWGPAVLLLLLLLCRRKGISRAAALGCAGGGFLLPLAAVGLWLWRMQALSDFVHESRTLMLYHAGLAHRPLGYLLLHSVAPVLPLVFVWGVAILFHEERWLSWERAALAVGLAVGLLSFLVQGKGYPYQRYPLIAVLLLVMGMDLVRAARQRGWGRVAGWIGLAYGVLLLAPVSAHAASEYQWWNLEFQDALVADLNRLGGEQLSGEVQCIDTVGGCYGALYAARLVESSGFLYDEFLFGAERNGVVADSRKEFWNDLQARPPRVIIVVDGVFPPGASGFGKLALWPEFNDLLEHDYSLYDEKTPPNMVYWWSRPDPPHRYRIYLRR